MLMNAKMVVIIAIRTLNVKIYMDHLIAIVKLASLEMGVTVKVNLFTIRNRSAKPAIFLFFMYISKICRTENLSFNRKYSTVLYILRCVAGFV